ncbi:MAG: T9SS type A sorting domain-containing protein [Bacteroidales bacterium]|nr:T9SS type A sorting domain-containing protein [Bacteroidales bacterium]
MRKIILYIFLSIASISFASAQSMQWQYATRFGGYCFQNPGAGLKLLNYPHNLEIDAEGNAYIFGTYGDNASFYDFSNGLAFDSPIYGDHCSGTFVAKFDCDGNVVWHKTIAREINIDHEAQYMVMKDNHLYLQGSIHIPTAGNSVWFLDTLVYGSYLINHPEDNVFPWIPNNYYTYIMELDLDGNVIDYNLFSLYKEDMYSYDGEWTGKRTYYLFDHYGDRSKPVPFAIDNQHNYYIPAKMRCDGLYDSLGNIIPQKMVFKHNGEDISDTIMPEDNKYVYRMLKFDQNFNLLYNNSIIEYINAQNSFVEMEFYDMKYDSENNIYICGYAFVDDTSSNPHYPIDIELANDKHIYIYTRGPEGIIIKMNSDGEILWVSQTRNHGEDNAESRFESMYLDEGLSNIYITDYSFPKAFFFPDNYTIFGENDTLVNNWNGGGFTSFTYAVVCYDTAGNYKWNNCPTTTECDLGSITANNGKLYAAACWSSLGLVCGESTYLPSEQLQGSGTPYRGFSICEWDLQGNMTNARQIYSKAQLNTMPYDTRTNSLGEIYTVGRFDNRMAFGEDTIIAKSESDMFIAKFGLPCQTYVYDTATYCYGEVQQGVTFTTSGDYTLVYPEGGQEFDSIVLVHATVLPQLNIGLSDTTVCTAQQFYLDACGDFDSYLWSTGGTGCTEMLRFDNACTQSVTLTVTRGECSASKTISITAQVCDGITEPSSTAMSLYPNPASNMVSILGDGFLYATIIDLAGRTIIHTSDMNIDISGLRPDEYIVKVVKIDGETEEMKLVKQ